MQDEHFEIGAASILASTTRNRRWEAYDFLVDRIIAGALPGGTIIEERALTEELGLSRTPLREALGRLEGEGYLVRQGRRLVVHTITERDFMEILHMRKILESEAVALAAPRLTSDQIQMLRTALASLEPPVRPSGSERRSVDDLLHGTIAESGGNRRPAPENQTDRRPASGRDQLSDPRLQRAHGDPPRDRDAQPRTSAHRDAGPS